MFDYHNEKKKINNKLKKPKETDVSRRSIDKNDWKKRVESSFRRGCWKKIVGIFFKDTEKQRRTML